MYTDGIRMTDSSIKNVSDSPQVMKYLQKGRRARQMRNAPFQFAPADWNGFFADQGWKTREMRYLAEESIKLGRPVPAPWWAQILRLISTAKQRASYGRFSGYAILEPK